MQGGFMMPPQGGSLRNSMSRQGNQAGHFNFQSMAARNMMQPSPMGVGAPMMPATQQFQPNMMQ
jgi:hypothetical protein